MSSTTATKLQHELSSLLGLSIINMMCCAFGFAFGALFLTPTLLQVAQTQTVSLDQLGLAILGAAAFAIAFRWLISTSKIIEATTKLNKTYAKHKEKQTLTDEAITSLIVDMTATYRENKPTLKLMAFISKIACAAFTLMATAQLISLAFSGAVGIQLWLTLLSATVCYGVAAASYIIPHFFGKYSAVWNQRLSRTEQAETQLQQLLGKA